MNEQRSIPRPEYPRPQFVRDDWLCLNGTWQFEQDVADSGLERGLDRRELTSTITVPFCPESSLSGVGNTDFMLAVWYRRVVRVPAAWAGRRMLLHFGAIDYDATVWVNGTEVGRHRGGFTPFQCDLTGLVGGGDEATIVVRARDDYRPPQPRGKQSQKPLNHGCLYTRTTGIWQTVWMEPVADVHLRRPRITPDVANSAIRLELPLSNNRGGFRVRAALSTNGTVVARAEASASTDLAPRLDLFIPEGQRKLWSPDDPHLYDLSIELLDGSGIVVDRFASYAGLRSVGISGRAVTLNGKPLFQRLVLDQGYYPDGLMTAPTEAALLRDIELSIAAGFNGARLHQKVFEERFLYHADRLGYLCWGEFADWGCGMYGPRDDHQRQGAGYVGQWIEAVERDYSHPSIVGWCPLNETWQDPNDRTTALDEATIAMYRATKLADATRPVVDASGYSHRTPDLDIFDTHDYEQSPEKFKANQQHLRAAPTEQKVRPDIPATAPVVWSKHRDQPYFVSEFGGIRWNPDAKPGDDSWGYGEGPKSLEEFYTRFEGLCRVLLEDPYQFAYCYTQLTDVFQEQNGIYRFNREEKFPVERVREAQLVRPAIEEAGI